MSGAEDDNRLRNGQMVKIRADKNDMAEVGHITENNIHKKMMVNFVTEEPLAGWLGEGGTELIFEKTFSIVGAHKVKGSGYDVVRKRKDLGCCGQMPSWMMD